MRDLQTSPARLPSVRPAGSTPCPGGPQCSPRVAGWLTFALLLLIAAAVSPAPLRARVPYADGPEEAAAAGGFSQPASSDEEEDFCDHGDAPTGEASAGEAADAGPDEGGPAYEGPLARLDDAGVGTLMLTTSQPGLYLPAPAVITEVDYRVTGFVARARVTQRFENPTDDWVEGIYVFPLPENAAVDVLEMRVGERVIRGEIQEKEEARRTYETARLEGRRASLTEQQRPNVFTTAVANLGPRETVEVSLELQHELRYDQGAFELRFPMVVGPRYQAGAAAPAVSAAPAGSAAPRGLTGVGEGSAPILHPSYSPDAENPVFLRVDLEAGFPVARIASPSHALRVESVGEGRLSVSPRPLSGSPEELEQGDAPVPADRDFVLTWAPRVEDAPAAAVFTQAGRDEAGTGSPEGDTYALLMVLPPQPRASDAVADLPREVVFVLDTSGSMAGDSIRQAKAALLLALETLEPIDSFNVIEFNSDTSSLFAASRPADPNHLAEAARWVSGLEPRGGTEMRSALAAALNGPGSAPAFALGSASGRSTAVRQVVFITDACVAGEEQLFAYIAAHIGGSRLFPVGIGSAQNSHFLARAAELGRGTLTAISDPREVEERMTGLFAKLESPVLADLEVVWDDPAAESWPERIPDLYLGEPLVVAVRLPGSATGAQRVELRGRTAGRYWERSLQVSPDGAPSPAAGAERSTGARADDDLGIDRLWARRKIAALSRAPFDEGVYGRDDQAAEKERRSRIVEVALAHHLVSAFTSLVAVDTEVAAPRGTAPAPRPIPVSLPAGWSWEATFGTPAPASVTADAGPDGVLPQGGLGLSRDLYLALLLAAAALLFAFMGRGARASARHLEEAVRRESAGEGPLADTVALRVEALWGDRPPEPGASHPGERP